LKYSSAFLVVARVVISDNLANDEHMAFGYQLVLKGFSVESAVTSDKMLPGNCTRTTKK